jgi:HTH-type transcriptional regulator/antitoxin HigA
MKPRIIKTEADYEETLARIDVLMESDPEVDCDEGKELELLVMLVEQYEDIHYPMDLPSPVEAIKFRMEQAGLKQVDLIPYIGSKGVWRGTLDGFLQDLWSRSTETSLLSGS